MKKTTYIIIGFLCALVVLAFAFPPIFFKKGDMVVITASGEYEELDLPEVHVIEMKTGWMFGDTPSVEIVQDSTLGEGTQLSLDKAWAENTVYTVHGDTLTIDLRVYQPKTDGYGCKYISDGHQSACIRTSSAKLGIMPMKGTQDLCVILKNFSNGDITTNGDSAWAFIVDKSEVDGWTHYRGDLKLNLGDGSSIGKLKTFRSCTVTTEGNAYVDSIILCTDNVDIEADLDKATFNTLVKEGTNNSVSLNLNTSGTFTKKL